MGYYKLQRPAWNPRGQEVKYIVKEKVLTRGWPKAYRDARSEKQLGQRSKAEQLNKIFPKLKPLLSMGYDRGEKPNGRKIGSYQMAFGHALRKCFSPNGLGWKLNLALLQLTDGEALLPKQLTIKRAGNLLSVTWERLTNEKEQTLLFAAKKHGKNDWITKTITIAPNSSRAAIELPNAWRNERVETWCAFLTTGSTLKSTTHYEAIA